MNEHDYSRNYGKGRPTYNRISKCSEEMWDALVRITSLKSTYHGYLRGQNRSPLGLGQTRKAYGDLSEEYQNILNGKYSGADAQKKVKELEKKYLMCEIASNDYAGEVFETPQYDTREIFTVQKADGREILTVPDHKFPEGFRVPPLETILRN